MLNVILMVSEMSFVFSMQLPIKSAISQNLRISLGPISVVFSPFSGTLFISQMIPFGTLLSFLPKTGPIKQLNAVASLVQLSTSDWKFLSCYALLVTQISWVLKTNPETPLLQGKVIFLFLAFFFSNSIFSWPVNVWYLFFQPTSTAKFLATT